MSLALASSLPAGAQTNPAPALRPVTLEEAFNLALSNNLNLKIERINPLLQQENLKIARTYYDPNFTIAGTHGYSKSGGGFRNGQFIPATESESDSFSSGVNGYLPYGGNYNLAGDISASDITTSGNPFSTSRSSGSAGISVSQPLLKNFLMDNGRYNIELSKNQLKQTEQQLQMQVMTVLNQVEQAYYDLIFARESVKVQERGLELAQRLLAENKKRVEIGTMAPLDEKQAQSQVAARQTDLIATYRTLNIAQNNLKRLITASYANWHDEQLEPTVGLVAVAPAIDLQESWRRAMTQRPDLIQARLELERQGINLKYYKNQTLPELDLRGSYGYNASGLEFHDAFGDIERRDKPFYTAGAVFSIPIGNRAAKSRYVQSKYSVDQALLSLKGSEQSVLVRVDDVFTQVKAAYAQVASTRAARVYAEQALDAEQKKLEAGKSTSFVVLQLQRDLTAARSDEIRALADYNKAQAQLAFEQGDTLKRDSVNVNVK